MVDYTWRSEYTGGSRPKILRVLVYEPSNSGEFNATHSAPLFAMPWRRHGYTAYISFKCFKHVTPRDASALADWSSSLFVPAMALRQGE